VVCERYADPADDRKLLFYRIENGVHHWPGTDGNQDLRASAEIWRFFARQGSRSEPR
jgi:poly(3-hydroxybutyrate) depolymerase